MVASIVRIYEKEVSKPLKRDFLLWLRRLLFKKGLNPGTVTLDESEVRQMLSANIDKFKAEAVREGQCLGQRQGLRKGLRKGRTRGQAEGLQGAAKVLLESRCGAEGLAELNACIDAEENLDTLAQFIRLVAQGHDLSRIREELWPV